MIFSTLLLSSLLVLSSASFTGPGIIWPCDNCNGFPVSLTLASALIETDLYFDFRPSTHLDTVCLELGIPSGFKIPLNPKQYQLIPSIHTTQVFIEGFPLQQGDNEYHISGVVNPFTGSYGPFTIKTRACCACQIVDETINFHFVNINGQPGKLQFKVSILDYHSTTPRPKPTVGSQVTISILIMESIMLFEKLTIRLDPIWDISHAEEDKVGGEFVFEEMDKEGNFTVKINNVIVPYHVQPDSYFANCTVRILSPPQEITEDNNYIVIFQGTSREPLTISPGSISDPELSPKSSLSLSQLTSGMTLFIDISFILTHELTGQRNLVEVEMSDLWVPLWNGDECVYSNPAQATCGISPTNPRIMVVHVTNQIRAGETVVITGLIEIRSMEALSIIRITSINPEGLKIDEIGERKFALRKANGVEMKVLLTDYSGRTQEVTAGAKVSLQFILIPPSAAYIDASNPPRSTAILHCSKDFQLPSFGNYLDVYLKKHSSNFIPINDYHVKKFPATVNLGQQNHWQIVVDLAQIIPINYGMFVVLVPGVTLPKYASNLQLAYECGVDLGSDTSVSQPIFIKPNPSFLADVYYYCLSSIPGAPIGVYIEPKGSTKLIEADPMKDFSLEMEFVVGGDYGFEEMLGSGVGQGSVYPMQVYVNKEAKDMQARIYGDSEKTILDVQLPTTQSSISSLLFRLTLGSKPSILNDSPVTLRIYSVLRSHPSIKNIAYETVSVLATSYTPNPSSEHGISLKILEFGNEGVLQVNISADTWTPQFIYVVFPSGTKLDAIEIKSPVSLNPLPLWTQESLSTIWFRYDPPKFPLKVLSFNIGKLSFQPTASFELSVTAAVSALNDASNVCKVANASNSTVPIVMIDIACAPNFSMSHVRANLDMVLTIQNGLVANTVIAGTFSDSWGTNFTVCEVGYPTDMTQCKVDLTHRTLNITVTDEVRDKELFVKLMVKRIKLPKNNEGVRTLFKELSMFVNSFKIPLTNPPLGEVPVCPV